MFQFAGLPSHDLWIQSRIPAHYCRRVSPFGYLRVVGCLHLTAAFRSLPRPSSAPIAKASTLCSLFLNLWDTTLSSALFFEKTLYFLSLEIVVNYLLSPLEIFLLINFLSSIVFLCFPLGKQILCLIDFRILHCSVFKVLLFRLKPEYVVGLGGLEPPTSRLSGVRSNLLSYRPIKNT